MSEVVGGPVNGHEAVDPLILAVVAAAADQVWPRRIIVPSVDPTGPPAWRFSGRWWTRPATTRRDRPWAGG